MPSKQDAKLHNSNRADSDLKECLLILIFKENGVQEGKIIIIRVTGTNNKRTIWNSLATAAEQNSAESSETQTTGTNLNTLRLGSHLSGSSATKKHKASKT
jgi:UDP-N-acetylmuramyl tripeptide synthase